MIAIATFLAGSLLSLLLPVLLLVALVAWYLVFIRRIPETADGDQASSPAATPDPVPSVAVSDEVNRPPDAT
ncbi:MAG: hypothetical protein JO244_05845 [Solirubrobacterales bacterium]|nr:hypothetical protein [Solirubrobacterales bacterium]